jgi:signal transduction histidine kinase
LTNIIKKRRSLHRHLTEQKEQNKTLINHNIELQALANLGSASHMIAHEINNLLTPLASYATLALKNLDDTPLVEKALQKTVQNCQRSTKVMETILAMANDKKLQKNNAGLLALVQDVFTCLCRDFSKDGITVNINIPNDLDVWVVPVQIQQVLMNLILNARDAMLPGGGILTITATEGDQEVKIEVRDTGCGVESSDLENIFESFFTTKANENLLTRDSGYGLGLAFCAKVIDAHSGNISVQSKSGEGTTFIITLPKPNSPSN